jgi:beta-lactamase class A
MIRQKSLYLTLPLTFGTIIDGRKVAMKKQRSSFFILRFVSLAFIFAAVLLLGLELVTYSRMRSNLPAGLEIAGVKVGGLTPEQAANRLNQTYSTSIEVAIGSTSFQLSPSVVGFRPEIEAMLTAADMQRIESPFWTAFWDYLWGTVRQPDAIPLRATYSQEQLRQYLTSEIAPRYNTQAEAVIDMSGSGNFLPGLPGREIDVDASIASIEAALYSTENRSASLTTIRIEPPRPTKEYLRALLTRKIELANFDGIAEIYLLDLNTRDELHFALENGEEIPPNIAFTAASTIKIPIMLSTFIEQELPLPANVDASVQSMIELSENSPSDSLMELIGGNLGPLVVTEHLQNLGFENSFIAGYFYLGAPLLERFETPANNRLDVNVSPDVYNQTTPAETGMLLDDLYQCANGGGSLLALYPDRLTSGECQTMLNYLAQNRIGVLIQAGVPDGTRVAHKHGWITESDGLIHTVSDVGIVYSPGTNYVVCIFLWHPVQLVFDQANLLFADLSASIYNYYNISQ